MFRSSSHTTVVRAQHAAVPNNSYRSIVNFVLTVGTREIYFSTTDQNRKDARIGFADNVYLTTADGAVWVRYMSWLYRRE